MSAGNLRLDVAVEMIVPPEALEQFALTTNPAVAELAESQHLVFDGWAQHGDGLIFRWSMPEPVMARPEEITLESVLKRKSELQREGLAMLEACVPESARRSQLPERAINCLTRGGYKTIAEVANAEDYELLSIVNLGKRSLELIRKGFG